MLFSYFCYGICTEMANKKDNSLLLLITNTANDLIIAPALLIALSLFWGFLTSFLSSFSSSLPNLESFFLSFLWELGTEHWLLSICFKTLPYMMPVMQQDVSHICTMDVRGLQMTPIMHQSYVVAPNSEQLHCSKSLF